MRVNARLFVRAALVGLTIMFTGCVSNGEDGINTLITTSVEPAGANCADGGMRIDIGLDNDGSGTLDTIEIESTDYMCNGIDGANGLDGATGATGANGMTTLVRTTAEPAGMNCADGGIRIDVGLDDDDNGTLEASEIDSTEYVCNGTDGLTGADGLTTLINTTTEAAGANCTDGGIRIDVGIDDDRNGTLEASEIDSTEYVCNGADGLNGAAGADGLSALVTTTVEAAGANCADGGIRIDVGIDDDRNGTLEASEIDTTEYVCNGANGANGLDGATGATGADGLTTLINTTPELAGANCTDGGIRIDVGLDDDANGTLEASEIDSTEYVCNGGNGLTGADGLTAMINTTAEPVGANCENGGIRIDIGLDDNRNGTLEAVEIDNTEYVCNGLFSQQTPQNLIAAGANHTLAIKKDGTLRAWGTNTWGQLGDGTIYTTIWPVQISSDSNWQSVTAGGDHTLAIKKDGKLWAWGLNSQGELGDGTTTSRISPIQIGSDSDWQSVTAGAYHTVAIKIYGTLWAWGSNYSGQLGDGTTTSRISPVQIGSDSNWQSAAAGANHTLAIKKDGTLWAWGSNISGQLGDGTTTSRILPVQIGSDSNWQSVTAGNYYTVAIKKDGTLWAWGSNFSGKLGDGTTATRISPVQIGSDSNWQSAAAGANHTLAIKKDGTLWAWGYNAFGQLGDGTTTSRISPVQIGSDSNWQSADGGYSSTVAMKKDGGIWAWGSKDGSGIVGNPIRVSPVQIIY